MAIGYTSGNYARDFNTQYNITLDLSGWDKTTIGVVAPINGAINIYSTNDSGALLGVTQGNAKLATNFTPAEVTNVATHAITNSISAAGEYVYTVNAQFLRLQAVPPTNATNVYKLLFFHSKVG